MGRKDQDCGSWLGIFTFTLVTFAYLFYQLNILPVDPRLVFLARNEVKRDSLRDELKNGSSGDQTGGNSVSNILVKDAICGTVKNVTGCDCHGWPARFLNCN